MKKLINRNLLKQILVPAGLITLVLFVALSIINIPLRSEMAPNGILTFELAKELDKSISIIDSWNLNAKINAGISLGIDFLFLIAYSVFFATACYFTAQKYIYSNSFLYSFGIALAILQFIAALFDGIENVALIKLLLGTQSSVLSAIAFYFASIKFVLIGTGIIYISIGLMTELIHKVRHSL